MALWKPFRGSRADLDAVAKHDGYVYFCDDGTLHFDHTDADGNLQRTQINAANAETLCGMTLEELKAYVCVQSDWEQADEAATDYIKNKPTLGALASKDVIGLVYDAENESLSIEYGVHLAPGEEEAVPVTEAHVHQIVDTAIEEEVKPLINEALVNYALKTDITTEERVNELIDAAINGALGGNY